MTLHLGYAWTCRYSFRTGLLSIRDTCTKQVSSYMIGDYRLLDEAVYLSSSPKNPLHYSFFQSLVSVSISAEASLGPSSR